MRKNILFLGITFLSQLSFSQISNTIYGLARRSNPASVYLSTIDLQSGQLNILSQTSASTSINLTGAALNPYENQYYFIGDSGLSSLNLSNGILSNAVLVSNPISQSYFDNFRFNNSDSLVYGLARRNSIDPITGFNVGEMYLSTINPSSGVISQISTSSIGNGFAYAGNAIDPHKMVYYYSDGAKFVGLDMYNGNIYSNPNFSFPDGGSIFTNFTYNCSDTAVYGLVQTNYYTEIYDPNLMQNIQVFDSSSFHLGKINPETGVVNRISNQSIGINSYSMNGSSTIDSDNLVYYFISGNSQNSTQINGVSLVTGLVVSQTIIPTGYYFDLMRIQSDCFGANPTRLVASIDEKSTQNLKLYPNPVTDYFTIQSDFQIEIFEIYSSDGTKICHGKTNSNEIKVNASDWKQGVYFVRIISNGKDEMIKIVK